MQWSQIEINSSTKKITQLNKGQRFKVNTNTEIDRIDWNQ